MTRAPSGNEHRCHGCEHLQDHQCTIDDMRRCPRMKKKITPAESLDYYIDKHAKLATPECRLMAALLSTAAHEIIRKDQASFGYSPAHRAEARAFIVGPLAKGAAEIIGINGECWEHMARRYVGAVGMERTAAK